ncbi:MAG: hypothetical protein D6732_13745 [Methanobacteriota archaeon]|nr:MAG: hypothetical protein D6732_13745 [Euryarchaeota archaeon]
MDIFARLSTVKAGVTAAWDGIKAGASFILKEMARLMLSGFATVANTLLLGLFTLMQALGSTGATIDASGTVPLITVGGGSNPVGMEFANDVFSLYLGKAKLSFVDIFGDLAMQPETLGSVGDFWTFIGLGEIASLVPFLFISNGFSNPGSAKEAALLLVASLAINLVLNFVGAGALTGGNEDAETVALHLAGASLFHFILGITLLQLGILSFVNGGRVIGILGTILVQVLDVSKNFFQEWFKWITGIKTMEFDLLFEGAIIFFASLLGIAKAEVINRMMISKVTNEEAVKMSNFYAKAMKQKRFSRSERNKFLLTKNHYDKLAEEIKIKGKQRLGIFFSLISYHLIISYLYAKLAGDWLE